MTTGDTFKAVADDNHLWMIISDTVVDSDYVVIVNFTSNRPTEEQHCIVTVGEHPFIHHDTAVRFRSAKIARLFDLHNLLGSGKILKRQPLSTLLLSRIRTGALASQFIPIGCRDMLSFQGIV